MRKGLIERRQKGSRPKWADGLPLYEHLNVLIVDLSTTEPKDLELVRGMLTLSSLHKGHGRSIMHYWRGDYHGAVCKPKNPSAYFAKPMRNSTSRRDEVTCILCMAWLRERADLCCRCSKEWVCGCRCKCHRRISNSETGAK